MASRLFLLPVAALFAVSLAGCPSNQSAVCQSVGDCSQGGSTDWVSSCQTEANLLQTEAQSDGCGTQYDDYYNCAEANFQCQGTTAVFPGCDTKLSALDTCINAAGAKTECAALAAAEVTCGAPANVDGGPLAVLGLDPSPAVSGADAGDAGASASDDAGGGGSDASSDASLDATVDATVDAGSSPAPGVDAGPTVPIACSAGRDCEARCYLTLVADVCAPKVNELDAVVKCSSACPQ
jgi:hypothetical protein